MHVKSIRRGCVIEVLAQKIVSPFRVRLFSLLYMEPQIGLEPMTCRLQGGCSTN